LNPDTWLTFLLAIVAPWFAFLVARELIEGVDLRRCWCRPVRWTLVVACGLALVAGVVWMIGEGV